MNEATITVRVDAEALAKHEAAKAESRDSRPNQMLEEIFGMGSGPKSVPPVTYNPPPWMAGPQFPSIFERLLRKEPQSLPGESNAVGRMQGELDSQLKLNFQAKFRESLAEIEKLRQEAIQKIANNSISSRMLAAPRPGDEEAGVTRFLPPAFYYPMSDMMSGKLKSEKDRKTDAELGAQLRKDQQADKFASAIDRFDQLMKNTREDAIAEKMERPIRRLTITVTTFVAMMDLISKELNIMAERQRNETDRVSKGMANQIFEQDINKIEDQRLMINSLINRAETISLIGSAAYGLGLGKWFGPKGAIAGGAIGLGAGYIARSVNDSASNRLKADVERFITQKNLFQEKMEELAPLNPELARLSANRQIQTIRMDLAEGRLLQTAFSGLAESQRNTDLISRQIAILERFENAEKLRVETEKKNAEIQKRLEEALAKAPKEIAEKMADEFRRITDGKDENLERLRAGAIDKPQFEFIRSKEPLPIMLGDW